MISPLQVFGEPTKSDGGSHIVTRNGGRCEQHPFLKRLASLTGLPREALSKIAALEVERETLRAHTRIALQDTPCDDLHILLDGWAGRYTLLSDGRRQITTVLLPGEVCDVGLLYLGRCSQSVTTLTECTVARIACSPLRALLMQQSSIASAFAKLLAIENAALGARIASLGRRSARERVAHLLCDLFTRLQAIERADARGYHLPLTQEEIADVLGLTAVHVNRVLKALRGERLIERRGHQIIISDPEQLRRAASFRPIYPYLATSRCAAAPSHDDLLQTDGVKTFERE
ncbi:Crp/Fnr family transcriptional regulator [Sphingomonas sp. TREG-RG-20F-R18-01]|uniref:Crp/Fnr family transcriptional regulator n=1 Tax=Sphingomonas sp. TREG-RG-20F-R18-01 TaxID=2914982 RepID=UPI001F59A9B5|nr:Crp/Fnr family transcriptional regulator [Sphingomonas sp. TREG-RG-20F-R18-01]